MTIVAAFPPAEDFLAPTGAVVAFGFVLAGMAPYVRSSREFQRAWNDARVATADAMKKLERAQQLEREATDAANELSDLGPNNVVVRLRRMKTATVQFFEHLDHVVLAVETARDRVARLKRFMPLVTRINPRFEVAIDEFEAGTVSVEGLRVSAESFSESGVAGELDKTIALAVEAATAYAMARSTELAAARPAPSPDECMAALKKIHDFATANGIKLTG